MRIHYERKSAVVRVGHEKKRDGVRLHHARKSNMVNVDHERKSDGARVHHKKERWGESSP